MLKYYEDFLMHYSNVIRSSTVEIGQKQFTELKTYLQAMRTYLIRHAQENGFFDQSIKPLRELDYIILDNVEKYYWFTSYAMLFYIWRSFHEKREPYDIALGIDFEFNSKVIALMQLELYGSKVQEWPNDLVVLLYPPDFSKVATHAFTFFTNYLLTMPKVVHGADSLDIPYLYYELLSTNPFKKSINREFNPDEINEKVVSKFTKNLVDTRFLCEMANIEDGITRRCSLYQLLEHTGVLKESEFNMLEKNEHSIGELWRVNVYLKDLTKKKNILMYCLHDVVFLKELYMKLLTQKLPLKSALVTNEVTRLIYLMSRKVSKPLSTLEQWNDTLHQMNIYFVINKKEQKITLQTLFETIITKYHKTNPNNKLTKLLQISNFKSRMTMLLKLIVYYYINQDYTIYSKNESEFKLGANIDIMFKLVLSSMPHFATELLDFRSFLKNEKRV
jgi:hypothetical protein